MHRSPANISLIVNRFFPLPVFFRISAHIIFCCILHLSQFLNRCSLVCVLYRHHPHSAVSEFFIHVGILYRSRFNILTILLRVIQYCTSALTRMALDSALNHF